MAEPSPKLQQSFAELREQGVPFLSIAKLKKWAKNPNVHQPGVPQLVRIIQRFGWTQPLIVSMEADDNGLHEIFAGHGRLMAAAEVLGLTEVPVIYRKFDAHEGHAYGLADNKAPEFSTEDEGALQAVLLELVGNDGLQDVLDAGYTQDELDVLIPPQPPGNSDGGTGSASGEPPTPEPPKDPVTKFGDVWVLGDHRVMCGDATDIASVDTLMAGATADLLFTDPPYGVSYQSNMRTKSAKFPVIENDDKILTGWLPAASRVSRGFCFIWTTWKVLGRWIDATAGFADMTNLVVWDKGGGGMGDLEKTMLTDHELALVFNRGAGLTGKRIGTVWDVGKDSASSYVHPTQKPSRLSVIAMDTVTNPGDVVLDLFGGSGSTLIGAEQAGRRCYTMELSPAYCDVIVQRWEQMTGKKAELVRKAVADS